MKQKQTLLNFFAKDIKENVLPPVKHLIFPILNFFFRQNPIKKTQKKEN